MGEAEDVAEERRAGIRESLEASVEEAATVRWLAGRESHGWGRWMGERPILELYEELLDAINYAREEHTLRRGEGNPATTWLEVVSSDLRALAEMVRGEALRALERERARGGS